MSIHRIPDVVILGDGNVRIVTRDAFSWMRSELFLPPSWLEHGIPHKCRLDPKIIELMSQDGLILQFQRPLPPSKYPP